MFNLSSRVVSLNVRAAWCDSSTLMSLYSIAKSFWELHKNALMKRTLFITTLRRTVCESLRRGLTSIYRDDRYRVWWPRSDNKPRPTGPTAVWCGPSPKTWRSLAARPRRVSNCDKSFWRDNGLRQRSARRAVSVHRSLESCALRSASVDSFPNTPEVYELNTRTTMS